MAKDTESGEQRPVNSVDAQHMASDVVQSVKDSANMAQQALDEGISAVTHGAALARDEYGKAYERSQVTCLFSRQERN